MANLTPAQRTAILATMSAGVASGVTASLTDDQLLNKAEIIAIQETEVEKSGVYEQVLKDGKRDKKTKLANFPASTTVDVYDGPKGKGYTIIEVVGDKEVHVSFGPEAIERSGVFDRNIEISTTTKKLK